jgi:hypothetical protein
MNSGGLRYLKAPGTKVQEAPNCKGGFFFVNILTTMSLYKLKILNCKWNHHPINF